MVREVKNLTNLKLTESGIDGIRLHFEAGGEKVGISLAGLTAGLNGEIIRSTIQGWAREQLDKCEIVDIKNWEEIKKELGRLALVIKGATNEEFPADLANLEDYIYKQIRRVREQLDKQETIEPLPPAPSNEFLKEGNEERTDVPVTRPSPSVEGGY